MRNYSLNVDGSEYAESMLLLIRTSKTSIATDAALTYEDGQLAVEIAGAIVTVPAEGTWPGTVNT